MFETLAPVAAGDLATNPSDGAGQPRNPEGLNDKEVRPFKQAFRTLASGISIVTFDAGSAIHGFTATSLTSVSMDPPLALFCVARQSRSSLHLELGQEIGFSFLAEHQGEHARFFSSKRPFGQCGSIKLERFERVPVVAGSAAVISAAIAQVIPAGDHIIYLCSLHGARSLEDSAPLLYHGGGYGSLVRNS